MSPRVFDLDRVGPYRIVRASAAEGATSFVAREEGPVGFRRDVTLKIVPEADPEHDEGARALAQEATLGSRLNHPNILRTHDFFARDGRLVLVLEHVDGITLAELLAAMRARGERLSDQAALYIGVAVLEGLAHAHAQVDAAGTPSPIVHHRLSPAAIALGKDGSVKLGGFSALPSPSDHLAARADPVTGAAPAAAGDQERVDVRAAGLLLWELLTGREAAAGFEALAAIRGDLPRELSAAVGAALDVTTVKRAIGCAEVASWIKKVARFAAGREELRGRVTLLAPPSDPEATPSDVTGESARLPLVGWTVRLAPIANRVRSVGTAWPRVDAAVRGHLRSHRRTSLAAAGGVALAIVLFAALRPSPPVANAAALSGSRRVPAAPLVLAATQVPAAPLVPAATAQISKPDIPAPTLAKAEPRVAAPTARAAVAPNAAPSDDVDTAATPADKVAYAVPGGPKSGSPTPPKGFGFLTVHSSIGYASVYVQLYRYGQVERRLTVRCGKRFVSLGTPKPTGGEPIWFAPSRYVDVPCGGSLEITMLQKWIR